MRDETSDEVENATRTSPRGSRAELHESEERARLIIESVRDYVIFMLDAEGRVATWNDAAERLKGYRTDQIVGRHVAAFYLEDDVRSGLPESELEASAREGRFETEDWRVRKDGSRFWASVVISAVRDPEGELVGFTNVTRGVTERHRATEQFRLALEAAPTGMLMVDRSGTIVLVNSQIEKLFGYRREELIGQPLEILVPVRFRVGHPAYREGFFGEARARLMGSGRELFGRRKDGSEVPVEIGLNPLHTPDGDFVLSSVVDITERRRAVEQFRLAIEAAPTGMLMVDRTGTIVLVNVQIEALFGYEREELIGQRVEMLVPERFRERHPAARTGFAQSPVARPMGAGRDLFGLRKDGTEVPIEIGLTPLRTPDGEFVLSSVVDITERKRRTSELTSALKEREVLLQEVHHRVKNNLQIISSLINMQLRNLEPGPSGDALVECQTRVQAIALIHEQLYRSQNYAQIPFADYVRGLANNVFAATGSSSSRVSLDLALDDVALAVDQAIPCGLVLNELITNSLKHAFKDGRSGRVRVELRRLSEERCRVSVEDDGTGLPEGMDISKSPSLGLQLVRTLAEQLDAVLEVESQSGVVFRLTFPARG